MRPWLIAGCCFVTSFSCCLVIAQQSEFASSLAKNNNETYVLLDQIISVEFDETCFENVVEQLGKSVDTQFSIHESAMDNALDVNTLITISLQNVRAATVLDLLLDPYQCTYQIKDGLIVILSRDASEEHLSRWILDVGDHETARELADLVSEAVDPDSWEDNGGFARTTLYRTKLVFCQTDRNLRQIRELIFELGETVK